MTEDKKKNHDLITLMIDESKAYTSLDKVEDLVETGVSLVHLPVQPLYLVLKSHSPEKVSTALSLFSTEQRTAFLDLDLWHKDDLDLENFEFWFKSYALCENDEIRLEFVKSSEFALYLKGRLSIWTFDVEDPEYPDHDNYFLTEDNQLLIEFDETFEYVNELRNFIRDLYTELGVDHAYTYLFKIVTDGQLSMQEDEFRDKNERLRDLGFVDYYEALEFDAAFPNLELMDHFIAKKTKANTGDVDDIHRLQSLHLHAVTAFRTDMVKLHVDLAGITDQKRREYLQFNFIRLVNATLALDNAIKSGPVAMSQAGVKTRALLQLGHDYLLTKFSFGNCFELFAFTDIYKIGNTLLKTQRRKLKQALTKSGMTGIEKESFFGDYWDEFLESSLTDGVGEATHLYDYTQKQSIEINNYSLYSRWCEVGETFVHLAPIGRAFYDTFLKLKKTNAIADHYYLNYTLDEIDLPAILLSTFLQTIVIEKVKETNIQKLGLTLDEFKLAMKKISSKNKVKDLEGLKIVISVYLEKYNMKNISGIENYFHQLLVDNFEGYDYQNLSNEDYKHIGGALILVP
jgi:hypothetical protein